MGLFLLHQHLGLGSPPSASHDVISDNIANASTTRTSEAASSAARVLLALRRDAHLPQPFPARTVPNLWWAPVRVVKIEKDQSPTRWNYDPRTPTW
jgi:flagellar basal body rod protein FlgC